MKCFNTILEAEAFYLDAFSWLDDWQQKYQYIIDLGKNLPELESQYKVDANIIRGCQSQVWMVLDCQENRLSLKASSDSLIVRGLIAMIMSVYHHKSLSDINAYDHGFIKKLGLDQHLSPTRSNGLHHMLCHILQATQVNT